MLILIFGLLLLDVVVGCVPPRAASPETFIIFTKTIDKLWGKKDEPVDSLKQAGFPSLLPAAKLNTWTVSLEIMTIFHPRV
jgi:hypothetical protein